jgi:ubiquinone/menaquinone biosynthesis C-methylase UbiE
MPLFRKGPPPHQTALAMIGVKPGQAVLMVGSAEAALGAEVARVTGLNGRTVVADRGDDARRRIEAAATAAGALIEFEDAGLTLLPFDSNLFDVVAVAVDWVALDDSERSRCAAEAYRVTRPGGRMLILIRAPRVGVMGRLRPPAVPAGAADDARERLAASGCRAVRLLAEADGVAYVEAVKQQTT